jgi:outer membrane lipoprotein-sorting protein
VGAAFSEPADIGGVRLATRLTVEVPASGQRIDIELRDPEVNPDLAESLFVLPTPPGVTEVDIDQVAN